MKKETDIFELFDQLKLTEPSMGWDQNIYKRIAIKQNSFKRYTKSGLSIIAIILLIAVNFMVLNRKSNHLNGNVKADQLKAIAADYLISTNSSKY